MSDTYLTCVTRARQKDQVEVNQTSLPQPLPVVRIPLREHETDAVLELQPLIDRCYRMGSYWNAEHHIISGPPFVEGEDAWLKQQVQAA